MNIPFLQAGDAIPERNIRPGNVGYAYLPVGTLRRVGLCVRHRPDSSPRLVIDLIVYYEQAHPDADYFRLVRTELLLEDLPKGVDILIGQRHWANARRAIPPPGSKEWRSLPALRNCDTSAWKTQTVSLLSWRNELRWPVSPGVRQFPPQLERPNCQMAIWHSDESVCVVAPRWLNASRKSGSQPPKLFRDDEYTYFFPEVPQRDAAE